MGETKAWSAGRYSTMTSFCSSTFNAQLMVDKDCFFLMLSLSSFKSCGVSLPI